MPSRTSVQYHSASGALFAITPELLPAIEALIAKVRADIDEQRKAGRFIGYLSVPVSGKSGGAFRTNTDMARDVAKRVQRSFGDGLWVLNPAEYNLPAKPSTPQPTPATGGDYMAVWSDVIAGENGAGNVFDLVYFVGPSDVWAYFDLGDLGRLDKLKRWLEKRAVDGDPEYQAILADPLACQKFLRFYGLRGSTVFSKGAHDEWNIVLDMNAKRPIGEDIAVYFDGKPIEPGDYGDLIDLGYETQLR